jgi:hypothetical protein
VSTITGVELLLGEYVGGIGPHTLQIRSNVVTSATTPGCQTSTSPGCAGCSCEECVCELWSPCCSTQWGFSCVNYCQNECGQLCEDEAPTPTIEGSGSLDVLYNDEIWTYPPQCFDVGDVPVTPGEKHWLVFAQHDDVDEDDEVCWGYINGVDNYPDGEPAASFDSGSTWVSFNAEFLGDGPGDFAFLVYGY